MIRMLIVGYCYSIRPERRLCREVDLNLAYRWFCRPGLEDVVPDHSTFSVNRHGRFRESAAFRRLFESVVHACMKARLVGGEGFAVDASVIEANASRFNRVTGGVAIDWTDEQQARRPVAEYLAALDSETPAGAKRNRRIPRATTTPATPQTQSHQRLSQQPRRIAKLPIRSRGALTKDVLNPELMRYSPAASFRGHSLSAA